MMMMMVRMRQCKDEKDENDWIVLDNDDEKKRDEHNADAEDNDDVDNVSEDVGIPD